MTTFTTAELATRAWREYNLYGAEETPSSADQEWAIQTITSEVEVLAGKDIPIWNGGAESVPENYLTLLALRIGAMLAHSCGMIDTMTLLAVKEGTERDLRILGQTGPTGETQQAEYF